MLVVDASCVYEALVGSSRSRAIRLRFAQDGDLAAPHIVDAEVLGIVRRERLLGALDRTAADLAVENLRLLPAERFGHLSLLERAWELRDTVRTWDALYVALAEALDAVLLTTDERLARASGPRCPIEVL